MTLRMHCVHDKTTQAKKKNCYSRDIHEVDLQFDHVILYDIDFGLPSTWSAVSARKELADQSHCRKIALQINLMNISAVKIFLAWVVQSARPSTAKRGMAQAGKKQHANTG